MTEAIVAFGWCLDGHHPQCRARNDTHTCPCTCHDRPLELFPSRNEEI